jgi:hypothetical protein
VFLPDGRRFLSLSLTDNPDHCAIYQGSIDSPLAGNALSSPFESASRTTGFGGGAGVFLPTMHIGMADARRLAFRPPQLS